MQTHLQKIDPVTKECPIEDAVKAAILRSSPDDPETRQRVMVPVVWRGTLDSAAEPSSPDLSKAVSFAAGVLDRVPTVKEFIDGIICGAEEIPANWQRGKS